MINIFINQRNLAIILTSPFKTEWDSWENIVIRGTELIRTEEWGQNINSILRTG